ncbi:MAG: hypothetical protein ACYC27_09770 [Armatimonadota bacterium]
MNRLQNWPSRRLQIAIIIILAASVAISFYMPVLSREGRANKLYMDSWCVGTFDIFGGISRVDKAKSIKKLEKALELSPGNSIYEQALVWQYPREKLPELLNRPKPLGEKARILASGLMYAYLDNKARQDLQSTNTPRENLKRSAVVPGTPGYSNLYPPEYWKLRLRLIDDLIAADPDNAYPRYLRALIYSNMERPPIDMLEEVRVANNMENFRLYMPDLPERLQNSKIGINMGDYCFDNISTLARRLTDFGDRWLKHGYVNLPADAYEQCCLMGIRISSSDMADYSVYTTSYEIFTIGWHRLEPVYKHFKITEKLDRYRELADFYKKSRSSIYKFIKNESSRIWRPFIVIKRFIQAVVIIPACIPLSLAGWGIMTIIRRKRGQNALNLPMWNEGWLVRLFVLVFIPFVFLMLMSRTHVVRPWVLTMNMNAYNLFVTDIAPSIIVFLQIVLVTATMIVLRRRYIEHTGERIGFRRFLLSVPSSVRAWRNRALAAMFVGEMVFLLCIGLVVSLYFKSVYGAHLWQYPIMEIVNVTDMDADVFEYSGKLQKMIPEDRITFYE